MVLVKENGKYESSIGSRPRISIRDARKDKHLKPKCFIKQSFLKKINRTKVKRTTAMNEAKKEESDNSMI